MTTSEVTTTDRIEAQLGELAPSYMLYRGIVEALPPDATVKVLFNEAVVGDRQADVRKKMSAETTHEQYAAAMEKARYTEVSARHQALIENGFAGTLTGLFEKVLEIEKAEDITELTTVIGSIRTYQRIPAERRRGAKLVDEAGYYWGGRFIPFEEVDRG